MDDFSYEVAPRSQSLGGGWRLRLFADGVEMGGGSYEPGEEAYSDALGEGDSWVASRGSHGSV